MNRIKWAYTMLLMILTIVACKKSDTSDAKELFAYAPTGSAAYNVTGGNVTILRNEIISGASASFPVLLSRPIDQDIQVTAQIDTQYLKSYDSVYKVTSPRFKPENFKIKDNGLMVVKAGATASTDSVQINIADTSGLDLTKTYVVPVRLSSTGKVPVSDIRSVMYVKLTLIKIVSSVSTGLISQTSGYTATIKASPVMGFPVSINAALSKDVIVTVADDASLVAAYNTANRTNYATLPVGTYTLTKSTATVSAGATTSLDSIKVQIPDLSVLTAGTSYLLPVKIKDEGSVVPAAVNNVKYIVITPQQALASIPASGSNMIDIKLSKFANAPDITGPAQTGFGAALNFALSASAQVSIAEDASLISSYNTANNTTYKAFPAGTFTITKDNVNILARATTSATDSFKIQFNNYNAFTPGNTYLLAVKIKDGGPVAAGTNKIVYIRTTIIVENLDPENSIPAGTTLSRTGWSVTASSTYSATYAVSNVLDGSTTTSWLCAGSAIPAYLILNMGSSKSNVLGFSFYPYSNSTYLPANMEVYSSTDGTNWHYEGVYVSTATTIAMKYIKFLSPVTAQYFKFNITKTTSSTSFTGFAELNGFQ